LTIGLLMKIKQTGKTIVLLENKNCISRSEAKKILSDLTHKELTLDFKGISFVGQGFVDQIFRVFQNEHPEIEIAYINANEDVEFMIKRGIASTK
jgi:hypothetical protein